MLPKKTKPRMIPAFPVTQNKPKTTLRFSYNVTHDIKLRNGQTLFFTAMWPT